MLASKPFGTLCADPLPLQSMNESLNPPDYQHIYPMSRGWMVFLLVFAVGAMAVGTIGLWFVAAEPHPRATNMAIVLSIFGLFIIFGMYVILTVFKSYIVLFADRIEVHGVHSTRVLRRDEILGRRFVQTRNSRNILLVPRGEQRQLKIALLLQTDPAFWKWMNTLPDLDAQDLKTSEEEIAGAPDGSSVHEDRLHGLAAGQRLARTLRIATFVVAGWGWLYPRPYNLVVTVLALLPWLAVMIAARSGGPFRINQRRNDAHPSLALAILYSREFRFSHDGHSKFDARIGICFLISINAAPQLRLDGARN